MLDLLADELLLKITNYLPLQDRLRFAATSHRHYQSCNDSLSLRKKLLKISAPLMVEPNLPAYIHYCKSRVARFKQEIAFFQLRQNNALSILGDTPLETLFLIKILKKITNLNTHLERTGDEKYIIQIDNLFNSLNARLINRQLKKGPSTTNLSLTCISRLPEHTLIQHREYFQAVRRIDLKGNCLERLPENISCCEQLQSLNLYANPVAFLPRNISSLATLEYFYMSDGSLASLPAEFFELKSLKWLALDNMQLERIPKEIVKLEALTWLYLANNKITKLPQALATLPKLREIFLEYNALRIYQSIDVRRFLKNRGIDWKNLLKTQKAALNTKSDDYSNSRDKMQSLCPLDLDIETLGRRLKNLNFRD